MKSTNKNIGKAFVHILNNPNRDEFYTTAETADSMIANIVLSQLEGKRIYCNCDGPESEIYKMFKRRFAELGLKSLLATKYVPGGRGVKTFFDGQTETISQLDGNGDCFSDECRAFFDEVDIVATNPPFSLQKKLFEDVLSISRLHLIAFCNAIGLLGHSSATKKCELSEKELKFKKLLLGRHVYSCFGGRGEFIDIHGRKAHVNVCAVTSLDVVDNSKQPSLTYAQLEAKGKLNRDDTGELEVKYKKYVPIDLDGTCLVPASAMFSSAFMQNYEVIGFPRAITVDGKLRFVRIRVRRRTANEQLDSIDA